MFNCVFVNFFKLILRIRILSSMGECCIIYFWFDICKLWCLRNFK